MIMEQAAKVRPWACSEHMNAWMRLEQSLVGLFADLRLSFGSRAVHRNRGALHAKNLF